MNFVILGASRGLGFALTEHLLSEGHNVAAGSRQIADQLNDLSGRWGDKLLILAADVTNEEQITAGAAKARETFGEIDAVCVAAGVLLDGDRIKRLHECDISELRRTLDVNTVGPIIAAKAYYPHMKKGGSFFIVTSEGVAISSTGTWVPCYGLSKTAATKSAGILNASVSDVNFYAVHPGRMNTDMGRTTAQIEPEESAEGFVRLMTGLTPLNRGVWYIDYQGSPMPA